MVKISYGINKLEGRKSRMSKNTVLICLVSDQTIPNVQFIKWYLKNNTQNMKILFLSTPEMEKKEKSKHIQAALAQVHNLLEYNVITTDENNMESTKDALNKYFSEKKCSKFIVNITGGTKLMSLATFQFFIQKENAEIYYQPIGKSLQQLYPETRKYDDISEILSLEEFLNAHGINFTFDNTCIKDWAFNKKVFDDVVKNNLSLIKKMVLLQNNSWFKNIHKRKPMLNFEEISEDKFLNVDSSINKEEVCELIRTFGFDSQNVKLAHIRYITGGWFEEYVYQKICNEYTNVEKENVALNVNISKGNDKNELDVIYLDKDNKLHVIECKSFVDGKEGAKVLNDALYKLQAIIKSKFGLYVKQHLFTKSIIDKETPLTRAKEFNIDIKDGSEI